MENNPFLPMLNRIMEIMTQIQNSKGEIESSKEITKELLHLEKQLSEIKDWANAMNLPNKDLNTLRFEAMRMPTTPEKDKKVFERALKVERDAKMLKAAMDARKPTSKKKDVDKEKQQEIRKRKKQFRAGGNHKKWMPL